MRATKRISVTLPLAMAREARSVSAIMRDALAKYQNSQDESVDVTDEWVNRIIEEAKADPWTPKQLKAEFKNLARYGARRAKKLGIESDEDIVRIIHEFRAENRAQSRS